MRILHYIPEHFQSIDINDEYMSMLKAHVARFADNDIAVNYSDFTQKAEQLKPEIIHIHACWNLSAYRVQQWAEKHHKAVVLSLHNHMQSWHVSHHLLFHKLPLLIIYQRKAIKNADAVLSSTETEMKRMVKIGWNVRNAMIRNALMSGSLTPDRMGTQLQALYQKVIDSNSFKLMTREDRELENKMLQASFHQHTAGEAVAQQQPNNDELPMTAEDMDRLRRIMIHSNNEGILSEIEAGAARLHIQLPDVKNDISEQAVDLFPPRLPKSVKPIERQKTIMKSRRKKTAMTHIMIDEKPTETERQICFMLLNVKQELRLKTLSRRHLTELYRAIRFTEYDEDMILRMFKQLGIRKFAARMLQIMKETYLLDEGFMPISPLNDKKTEAIRKQLSTINTQ